MEKVAWQVRLLIVLSSSLILTLNPTLYSSLSVQLANAQPSISDTNLIVQRVVDGLSAPTDMIFVDKNNILVLEKEGNVRLVTNGTLQDRPVLQMPVNTTAERGLVGITMSVNSKNPSPDIFLYYTKLDPLRNMIYKFQWNGETLVNPLLILDFPAKPDPYHNGGKMAIGPDGYLYVVIGDLHLIPDFRHPEFTGKILRISQIDGSAAPDNPFVSIGENVSKYYAYGIRNSFGLDFDPVTGNLWDTENGPIRFDEINLVRPGFNSGYYKVMGPISLSEETEDDLFNLPGSHYSDPVFSWNKTIGPTDIEFFRSSNLGDEYENNIFVGDIRNGNLYFFELDRARDGIELDKVQQKSGLSDLVVNNEEELSSITFGSGFGGITDIETGPEGYLYILSYFKEDESKYFNMSLKNNGTIYKISPNNTSQ